MRAERLLRLYPRPWRDRYGEEFVDMLGPGPLQFQQVVDIVSGAIDAWLSADVRGVTRAAAPGTGGMTMVKAVSVCEKNQVRYTKRDGLLGAAVMILGSLLCAVLGGVLKRRGLDSAAEAVTNTGWLIFMTLSMPLWLTKGQPLNAQLVLVGGPTALLIALALINL